MRSILTIAVLLIVLVAAAAQSAPRDFDGKSWWEHVKVLADDRMEGRETGSEGLRKAEAYAVEQFKQAGVQPAGSDGFYQPVKFSGGRLTRRIRRSRWSPKTARPSPSPSPTMPSSARAWTSPPIRLTLPWSLSAMA